MIDAPENFEADGEVRWLQFWGWPLSERRLLSVRRATSGASQTQKKEGSH